MPSFRWSAITPGGEVMHGITEAVDRASVVERLQRQGQVVLRAEPADGRWRLGDLLQIELGGRRGLDRTTLGEVTRELAIMLGAGQDLDRALRFVVENVGNARARAILGEVRDKVRSGSSLAAALAAEPRSFSRLYVGLVRAGGWQQLCEQGPVPGGNFSGLHLRQVTLRRAHPDLAEFEITDGGSVEHRVHRDASSLTQTLA